MEEEKYSWPWTLEKGSILLPEAEKSCQHQYHNVSATPALRKSIGFQTQNLTAAYCPCWNISTDSVKWLQCQGTWALLSSAAWNEANKQWTWREQMGIKLEYKEEARKRHSSVAECEMVQIWNEWSWNWSNVTQQKEWKECKSNKNMIALCKKILFALKLRSDESSVLVSVAASGQSSECRLDWWWL